MTIWSLVFLSIMLQEPFNLWMCMTDSGNVEKTLLLKDFLNSASYIFNVQLEKKIVQLKQDASVKIIVFLILTTYILKVVVKRLREVRDSSVSNRMVTVLNNFPSAISLRGGISSNFRLWVRNRSFWEKQGIVLRNLTQFLPLPGGDSYLKIRPACQTFWKEPPRVTKVLFCGHGLNFFSP